MSEAKKIGTKEDANGVLRAPNGQFVKGTPSPSFGKGGRKKAEFSLQALIDKKIPQKRWGKIIDAMAAAAILGDVHAARLLLEHRFGKPKADVSISGAEGGPFIIYMPARGAVNDDSDAA